MSRFSICMGIRRPGVATAGPTANRRSLSPFCNCPRWTQRKARSRSGLLTKSKRQDGEGMTKAELRQIWEKTQGHCHCCGDPVEFYKRGWRDGDLAGYWEIDHVIQRDKGG